MTVKLLTENNLEFLSLKGGYIGSSESTLVKMPHCLKSHVAPHFQCSLFSGTFTIFAPTNAAFSKIPKATLASLEQDTQALSNILLFHVAQGRILSRDARDELTITTLNGDKVRFNIYTHNNVSTPLTCFLFNLAGTSKGN